MTTTACLDASSLSHIPSDMAYSMRDAFDGYDKQSRALSGILSISTVFDTSRVQLNKKNEYVIDDAVVLSVTINPKLEPARDHSIEHSRNEAIFGLSSMLLSGLFLTAAFLFPEVALPLFIVAGVMQVIGLSFLGAATYHSYLAKNITHKIENPNSHEEWIEKALAEIIARRDYGFSRGLEYVVQNTPKEIFSRDERNVMYGQFLDRTLIGRESISEYLNSPVSINDRIQYLL